MATNNSTEKEKGPEKVSNKGRSCKGTLYYSTALKSKAYNPICLGVPRTLPQVPDAVVVATEREASREDRHVADFRYACAGYSMYLDRIKEDPSQKNTLELPVCIGLVFLVGKRIHKTSPAAAPVSTHVHHKEDAREVPQTQRHQPPTQSAGTVFLNKFSRNADLVASGVTKNVYKVGNYIKGSLSDFLFPYRGRSKVMGVSLTKPVRLDEDNVLVLVYCPTNEQLADIFTKSLAKDRFCYLKDKLGVKSAQNLNRSVELLLSRGLARIQPIKVEGIENVDVTDVIDAHSPHLWGAQQILDLLELEAYYPVFQSTICIQ